MQWHGISSDSDCCLWLDEMCLTWYDLCVSILLLRNVSFPIYAYHLHDPKCLGILILVPAGSPSRDGDVNVYIRYKPTELAHSFYFRLVVISVFTALSTTFGSIDSPNNSPFSHSFFRSYSVLSVHSTISLWKSLFRQEIGFFVWLLFSR